jgi:L,D-transpeptidase ErfK/SrfK
MNASVRLSIKRRTIAAGSGAGPRGTPGRPARRTLAALIIGGMLLGPTGNASADLYRLASPSDGVVGTPFYVKTADEHTLLDIGRHHGLGYDEMRHANPGVDMWVPGGGTDVLVPAQHVLPKAPRAGIVLNLAEKRLYYFRSPTLVETYPISIGREGWSTPTGRFSIAQKIKDPTWTPPASIRREHAEQGDILPAVVPAGPDNPLGQYAMRLSIPSYLIHGTNKPWGVGMQVSHGCIRMYPEDIERLFPEVAKGTPVTIVKQPYKVGWLGDELYLEVTAPDGDAALRRPVREIVPASVAKAEGVVVDWDAVRRVQQENAGLPRVVGGRRGSGSWHHLDMIF